MAHVDGRMDDEWREMARMYSVSGWMSIRREILQMWLYLCGAISIPYTHNMYTRDVHGYQHEKIWYPQPRSFPPFPDLLVF